jgi:Ras-related protein Rab-1A
VYFDRRRLRALLKWYHQEVGKDLIAALIVDRDGLLIDAISKDPQEKVEEKFIGAFGALVETILKKITKDFDLGTFGAGTFDTDKYRFIFCEAGQELILVSVLDALAMIDPYFAYSYLAAEKIARIFEGENVSPVIPKIIIDKNLQNIERKVSTLQKIRYHSKDNVYKLILGGDGAVGKTSIVKRFTEGTFQRNYKATIGTSISKKECKFEGLDSVVRFVIWDLAGQPQFKRIRGSYLANSGAGILVFDVTNRESFNNVRKWYKELKQYAPPDIYLILVGNKIDLKDLRVVSNAEGKALAEELGLSYIESSAKTGENINEAFKMLALQLIQRFMKAEEVYKIISKLPQSVKIGDSTQIPEDTLDRESYTELPLNKIWESIEQDLTPWINRNLDVLNDLLNLQLKPIDSQNTQFSKELIVRDEIGENVLILSQYNQTDFYHLGILVSKLVSEKIRIVIWICEESTAQHKEIVQWLNRNINDSILFYLLELKLLKVEDYSPFPKFNLIQTPPQTSLAERMKKRDKTLTKAQKIRIDFWIGLVEKIMKTYPQHADIKISKTPWISYPTFLENIEYRYIINDNWSAVGLFFVHDNPVINIERIDKLKNSKKEIIRRFKEINWALSYDLEWSIKEERNFQYIQYKIPEKGLKNKQLWEKIQFKLIDAMKTLEGVFNESLQKLFNER